jgi:hypothetical protein
MLLKGSTGMFGLLTRPLLCNDVADGARGDHDGGPEGGLRALGSASAGPHGRMGTVVECKRVH